MNKFSAIVGCDDRTIYLTGASCLSDLMEYIGEHFSDWDCSFVEISYGSTVIFTREYERMDDGSEVLGPWRPQLAS